MNIAVAVKFSLTDMNRSASGSLPPVWEISPADETALENALRMKGSGEVTVLTLGRAALEPCLRPYFALGVDRSVLLTGSAFAGSDTYATAVALARALGSLGGFDAVFCGRQSLDGETGQVPAELASRLDRPFVTDVLSAWEDGDGLCCRRLTESGILELSVPRPALLSFCAYGAVLRPPSITGLRRAKGMEVTVLDGAAIGLDPARCGQRGSYTQVVSSDSCSLRRRQVRRLTKDTAGLKELVRTIRGQSDG